jgi:hypothetical protein
MNELVTLSPLAVPALVAVAGERAATRFLDSLPPISRRRKASIDANEVQWLRHDEKLRPAAMDDASASAAPASIAP